MCQQCADLQPEGGGWGGGSSHRQLRTLTPKNTTQSCSRRAVTDFFFFFFGALNYSHCWMAHLDDWRARWLSMADTACLSQKKKTKKQKRFISLHCFNQGQFALNAGKLSERSSKRKGWLWYELCTDEMDQHV